jgi:hypothetical protein
MTKRSMAGLTTVTMLVGTLACAGSMAREEDTAAAPDTTEAQNPAGYRGMERDTTQMPTDSQPTPATPVWSSPTRAVPRSRIPVGRVGATRPVRQGWTLRACPG